MADAYALSLFGSIDRAQGALRSHLQECRKDLIAARFDVLLYDLYFESDPAFAEGDKRRFVHSRDQRFDCVQVVIALAVTPEGFPLGYEVLPGGGFGQPLNLRAESGAGGRHLAKDQRGQKLERIDFAFALRPAGLAGELVERFGAESADESFEKRRG